MNNLCRAVLSLLLVAGAAVPAFGETGDFSVSMKAIRSNLQPADRVAAGEPVYYRIEFAGILPEYASRTFLEMDVPGVIEAVGRGLSSFSCTEGRPIRCSFSSAFTTYSSYLSVTAHVDSPGTYTATARILHDGIADPNSADDSASHTLTVPALPSLAVYSNVLLTRIEPGQAGSFSAGVVNHSVVAATNVVMTVTLPEGGTIVSGDSAYPGASCTLTGNTLVCTKAQLTRNDSFRVEAGFTAPPRLTGEDFAGRIVVTADGEDFDPSDNVMDFHVTMVHQFAVTNTNDEGGGSLRQALLDANALCPLPQPCGIVFQLPAPVPEDGWFTIQPRTPLPEVEATLKIDGATQTAFTGDTNADGPEIEINGALLQKGSGLLLHPNCDMQIRNLAVNGFPGYGIEIRRLFAGTATDPCFSRYTGIRLSAEIRNNYLGTDPRGRTAKPNQRGLGLFTTFSYVLDNLIGGNLRSGIYAAGGAFAEIYDNRIGVAADGAPLGNGAGIFLDMGQDGLAGARGADLSGNVIAYNNGMAIARTRSGDVAISRNAIFDNLLAGIDVDVDGVSPQRGEDWDVPNAPVLFDAAYDAVRDVTIVRGRLDSHYSQTRTIEVYASSRLSVWGAPQAERSVAVFPTLDGHQDLEIAVPGDLRGKWITATNQTQVYLGLLQRDPREVAAQAHDSERAIDTSELSNAVLAR